MEEFIMARRIYDTSSALNFNPSTGYSPESYVSLGNAGAAASKAGLFPGIKAWFGKNFNALGSNQPLFKGNVNIPSLANIRNQQLFEGGPSLGGISRAGMGIYQGGKALKGVYDNIGKESELNSLKRDINTSIASNPMYDMYMDAKDERLLREMQNGNLTNAWGGAIEGGMKGIPQALLATLIGGVTGGWGGAAIGGLGSLVNSGIQGYGNNIAQSSDKLQGLYDRLRQAESDYRAMKRPSGLSRAGLQTQYFNQMY